MISKRFLAELQYAEPHKEQFCQKSFWYHYFLKFYQILAPEVPFMYCLPHFKTKVKFGNLLGRMI